VDPGQDGADGIGQPVTAAVCGLFCSACTFFIGTHEDPERLDRLADQLGLEVERLHCDGCRSDRRLFYCGNCRMFACAAERGYGFCSDCPEYPCPELQAFIAERPHRADIPRDLARIAEIGGRAWLVEATIRHTCPDCGTMNSAYDLTCRACGRDPSSPYVAEHRELILARMRSQ
jgi:Protein of unknown function (DUF3795)